MFGPSTVSPPALDLCWEHGVAVNFLSESGYLHQLFALVSLRAGAARLCGCAHVFECQVGQKEWVQLRDRLLREIKADEDSLRFYFLDEKVVLWTEHHGMDKPVDLIEPLIL